jgi:hypothetical protein
MPLVLACSYRHLTSHLHIRTTYHYMHGRLLPSPNGPTCIFINRDQNIKRKVFMLLLVPSSVILLLQQWYSYYNIAACTDVATQQLRNMCIYIYIRPFLGNSSVNTIPRQRTQGNNRKTCFLCGPYRDVISKGQSEMISCCSHLVHT